MVKSCSSFIFAPIANISAKRMGIITATQSGRYFLRFELRVTARHGDDGTGIAAVEFADQVAAFLVGVFGHRTAVDYADIGFGRRGHTLEAPFGKLPGERGTLREVELAAHDLLAGVLQMKADELYADFTTEARFIWLKRTMEPPFRQAYRLCRWHPWFGRVEEAGGQR